MDHGNHYNVAEALHSKARVLHLCMLICVMFSISDALCCHLQIMKSHVVGCN